MIETERLLIRPPTDDERAAILELWFDPASERVPPDVASEQVRAWVDAVPWGVWERETGELVGDCGLFFDEGHGEWELAYGFRRDRWGRGYATEAARACVSHGFDELGLEKIVADVDSANPASVRVLEHCGFENAGPQGDGKLLYAVTRSSARARAARGGA
jgi:ribosomal-protein-alanine N-acetyltransferase